MSFGTPGLISLTKIYRIFMVPKPIDSRLCTIVNNMNTNYQIWEQMGPPISYQLEKESKLKLSVEARNQGDIIVVHCQGRIVYRDEAAALSRVVNEILHEGSKVVLDLAGVTSIDSAGIGELALLHSLAQGRNAELKCAGANELVSTLLELTNLDSVLDIHVCVEDALESFHERMCADC
jgi:anti-sigma B factor antagonist